MKKLFVIAFILLLTSCRWVGDAQDTAFEEFKASTALKKYEWFQTCSATLDEKFNTIKVYEQNIIDLDGLYVNIPRRDWDQIDKQQYNQWRAEITGIKASYNKVVKEYNAQSSKFNWQPFNHSELPRIYKAYVSN